MRVVSEQRWMDQANCAGVNGDLFFPAKHDAKAAGYAKAVCAQCVVKDECLSYALANDIGHGIWGGLAPRDRRRLNRVRRVS